MERISSNGAPGSAGARGDYAESVERLTTLELVSYPRRATFMATAACLALLADFVSKTVVVAIGPQTLLFNVNTHSFFGQGARTILVPIACSLLACVLPPRVVTLGAGVALGGALGNLASRYWWAGRGGAPDFIPFSDGSTGNLADLFILTGGGAMLLGALVWFARTVAVARRV